MKWKCPKCGYIHEGKTEKEGPLRCPICGMAAERFVVIERGSYPSNLSTLDYPRDPNETIHWSIEALGGCWFSKESKWYLTLMSHKGQDGFVWLTGISILGCITAEENIFKVIAKGASGNDAIVTFYKTYDDRVTVDSYYASVGNDSKLTLESADRTTKAILTKIAPQNNPTN